MIQPTNVPLVGVTIKVFDGVVLTTVQCHCATNDRPPPMLLRGTDFAVTCTKCLAIYRIVRVSYDLQRGDKYPAVTVAQVGRAQPPSNH